MADANDKFNLTISFGYKIVKQTEDGKTVPYMNFGPAELEYKNMDYAQIVETQKVVVGLGEALIGEGEKVVEEIKGNKQG